MSAVDIAYEFADNVLSHNTFMYGSKDYFHSFDDLKEELAKILYALEACYPEAYKDIVEDYIIRN